MLRIVEKLQRGWVDLLQKELLKVAEKGRGIAEDCREVIRRVGRLIVKGIAEGCREGKRNC